MSERGARTRARLIQATTDVVGQVGYARATTRAIADAAGVAEGTIYRHFPDKQQLFFAAVLERNAPVMDWVSQLPALAGQASVRQNLTEALVRLGRLRADLLPLELSLRADPDLARDLHQAAAGAPANGPPESITAYLAAEQGLGRVRADVDVARAAMIILAVLFGLAMIPAEPERAVDPALIGAAVDLLLSGLEPQAYPPLTARASTA
jgi:AcrR family transcriptional regulator